MKNIYLLLIAAGCSASAIAQVASTHPYATNQSKRWALDVNLLGGKADQTFTTANSINNYPGAMNGNTGVLKYDRGYSYGANLQLGYFFGHSEHFGIGTGIMFMEQRGEANLDAFHIDFRSTDVAGNTFRQVLSGYDIREDVVSSMVNIPVMLKFKTRFSKRWGFSTDAGAVINLQMKNAYSTNAKFNREAIYKFVQNSDGGTTSVYDNSTTPSAGSWLVTRAEFLRNNPGGDWAEYARIKRSMGINVGDQMITASRTGKTTYQTPSVGFMIQPSFNYYLSDNVSIKLGGYYMLQPFKNKALSNYRLTDGYSSYSSVLDNVTASVNTSYGVNLGVSVYMGRKDKDHDNDGITDRKDDCPDVFGLAEFNGCPDTDKDGIQDSKDSCVTVFGLAKFNGCPDTDGDGLADRVDECPFVAGPIALNGCPDKDKDGIADKNDLCPDVYGVLLFRGCPDTDGDGIADSEDKCPMVAGTAANGGCPDTKPATDPMNGGGDLNTPILFEVNMSTVKQSSMPGIEDAVNELNADKNATLQIDGHADASGPDAWNKILSLERAKAVKAEVTQRGIKSNRVNTIGHGSNDPAATNDTYDGKEQNRRAKMTIKK
jgi:outer membrane protein OmpA-like peptidoglycan-associated protein